MNMDFTEDFLKESCQKILHDPACGKVFRIKGFQKLADGSWISINVTHQKTEIEPIPNGQAILIVIGEGLNQEAIEGYWGEIEALSKFSLYFLPSLWYSLIGHFIFLSVHRILINLRRRISKNETHWLRQ